MPERSADGGPAPAVIQILLHAQLRYYNGGDERLVLPWRDGATIRDYIDPLQIPGHEWMGTVLDGELSSDLDRVPGPGSTLELVPAMSGG